MKKKTDDGNRKEEDEKGGIRNFVDMQAIKILMHLSGNPKTRSEMRTELREIPSMSLYRKIIKLEEFGLIKQIIPANKKRKRNNAMYEVTSRNFVMRSRGRSVHMTI